MALILRPLARALHSSEQGITMPAPLAKTTTSWNWLCSAGIGLGRGGRGRQGPPGCAAVWGPQTPEGSFQDPDPPDAPLPSASTAPGRTGRTGIYPDLCPAHGPFRVRPDAGTRHNFCVLIWMRPGCVAPTDGTHPRDAPTHRLRQTPGNGCCGGGGGGWLGMVNGGVTAVNSRALFGPADSAMTPSATPRSIACHGRVFQLGPGPSHRPDQGVRAQRSGVNLEQLLDNSVHGVGYLVDAGCWWTAAPGPDGGPTGR